MSHWGWDIFGILIAIALLFVVDYESLIDASSSAYTNRNYKGLFSLIGFFLGKKGVYAFIILAGVGLLFDAIIKIKKITLTPLRGARRILWATVRLAFLTALLFLIKHNITNSVSLNHKYDIVLGLSVLPLVAWIILAKTKFSMWHFIIIIVYVTIVFRYSVKRIIQEELHNEHVKTIGIIDSVEVKKIDVFFIYNVSIRYDGHNGFFKHKVTGEKSLKYARLTRGDTITLIYLPRHARINNIVNLFPTSKEIEEYKKSE